MEAKMKKLDRRVYFLAALWFATYCTCLIVLKEMVLPKITATVIAVLPAVTFALYIYNHLKAMAAFDEVEMRIHMEAVVIAFALVLLLNMLLAMLDLVAPLDRENWGYRHLFPYYLMFYFAGIFRSRRKYL